MNSIRVRLFAILLATTGSVWLFAAAWIYASTQAEVERVLDARLMEAARMVSSLITDHRIDPAAAADAATANAPPPPFEEASGSYSRQLSCQIWSLQGNLVSRSESAPETSLASHTNGFEETEIDGERWRVYAVVNPSLGVRVLVGDSLEIRDRLIGDVIKGLLLPGIVILPVLAALIWLSVGRGLAPLTRIAEGLAGRSASELHPVDDGTVPQEVRPVIRALNSLFGRVAEARDRERSFTAYAAHELKTPLAGLKTQAQIALRTDDQNVQREALSRISTSVDRTSRMVRQLIDLAAIDASQGVSTDEPVDIAVLLGEIASELETQLAANDVHVAVELADQTQRPTILRGDRVLVRLAIRNLLENAIQHSPKGEEVRCRIVAGLSEAFVEILDQGPGIPQAEEQRVTERFFRGSKAHGRGSGLGLSIVQMALDRLGGSLTFERGGRWFTARACFPLRRSQTRVQLKHPAGRIELPIRSAP
ncbi:ATP-binding protein [Neorhizobium sp. Rsf11]|uniref:histidine kinase n=2 Tax=Neorhizobium TaxID=1525371 RepID=A0ABV0MFV8_9HYPH|nr:ATP-binding protein [Neorhizobium petrolearium]MCC2613841.1 sensor histidine kinase N-terminal domain-containing protein [Neorhizobium petrolearium]WGI72147.1 sensor histidine kinase N-terminal domain-containing protein [Neorhizobium petrolearium]